MKKKLLTMILTIAVAFTLAVPAFAAKGDGVVADEPVGGTGNSSTGEATITSTDGATFETVGDDDALAGAADVAGADINVWAKVTDSGSKIYKVDLAWGAMKFEFNSGSGQWDTTDHVYTTGGGAASWTPSYIEGTNNKVTVTNHSNNAIDAGFAYTMDGTSFNDNSKGDNAVLGNFFDDNTKALAAAAVLTGTYTGGTLNDAAVADKLANNKVTLPTADAYNSSATEPTDGTANVVAGARIDEVFFAFSGTPDTGRGATLDTFKKVGVITVTVAPNTEAPLNRPAYTGT